MNAGKDMLACFLQQRLQGESPLLSVGSRKEKEKHAAPLTRRGAWTPTPEEEEAVYSALAPLRESLPMRHRAGVVELLLGGGANGLAYFDSGASDVLTSRSVTLYFSDSTCDSPTERGQKVMDAYLAAIDEHPDVSDGALADALSAALNKLEAPFVLLLSDREAGRLVAARDSEGTEPLHWGRVMNDGVLFASERSFLEKDDSDYFSADADAFPPGTVFACTVDTVGTLRPIREASQKVKPPRPSEQRASSKRRKLAQAEAGGAGPAFPRVCSTDSLNSLKRVPSLHEIV